MKQCSWKHAVYILALLILVAPYISFVVMGMNSFLPIGDGLDSNHLYLKLAADNATNLQDGSMLLQPVGGVPQHKGSVPSPISLLFLLFSPFWADVLNRVLIAVIAFISMQMLLFYLNPEAKDTFQDWLIFIGVSLSFGLCRFWPYAGISVAGLPLVFYAYLSASKNPIKSQIITILYAWYSNLALVGIFLLVVLGVLELIRIIRRETSIMRIAQIATLCVAYMVFNYSLMQSVINPIFVTHRKEFNLVSSYKSIVAAAKFSGQLFLFNGGHNSGYPSIPVLTFIFSSLVLLILRKRTPKLSYRFFIAYVSILIVTFIFNNKATVAVQQKIPLLGMLQLQRFYWLLIPIQYLLFYQALVVLKSLNLKKLVIVLLLCQTGMLFYMDNFNTKQMVKRAMGKHVQNLSYNEFYSTSLMSSINSYIGKPQNSYRVASVGLYPAVALYSGFYTIDGYYSRGYPLEHKHMFGKMLEAELAKNEVLWHTFNDWGSPCYLFSDDIDRKLGYNGGYVPPIIKKTDNVEIEDLQIDTTIMAQLNCQYVFSAVPINNAEQIKLHFERYFDNERSPYRIYLYSVKPAA
ncbi:MAG: DUF6044 family protein [Candidatus Cloacimonas sp.]|jgi:hypothetical protein|nr:DUF6044 family protein [Candidatus Cloacimonas sp.]